MFVPIFITDRDNLRKKFFDNNIFVPKHWPKHSDIINGNNMLYEKELSLICDQRYGTEDMYRQIDVLKQFINNGEK